MHVLVILASLVATPVQVLGIHCYQPPSLKKTAVTEAGEGQRDAGSQEEGAKEGEKAEEASPPSPLPDDAVLEGLTDEIQDMLKVPVMAVHSA